MKPPARRRQRRKTHRIAPSAVRNFVFGVEDSLVSTVGLLSGIAAAGSSRDTIVLTGLVLVAVEAFSMGVGTFLSEQSEQEYTNHKDGPLWQTIQDSVIMAVSYVLAGILPIAPYLFTELPAAFPLSVASSTVSLGILGLIHGVYAKMNPLKSALKMAILGGLAIGVGVLVGQLVQTI